MTLLSSTPLYLSQIGFSGRSSQFWYDLYQETGPGGKFAINLGRNHPNKLQSRSVQSIWSTPWPQEIMPKYFLEAYNPTFDMSLDTVSDLKALEIAMRINRYNEKFAVMYSGGIDSTLVMVALLKNLTNEELKNITIYTSAEAIIENPDFWRKYINNKFKIIDSMSNKCYDLLLSKYTLIDSSNGDNVVGAGSILPLYQAWQAILQKENASQDSQTYIKSIIEQFSNPNIHYSKFKDLIIAYFSQSLTHNLIGLKILFRQSQYDPAQQMFGQQLYDKVVLVCNTSPIPINSLCDFFWWYRFNLYNISEGTVAAFLYNDNTDLKTAINYTDDWYNNSNYSQWSMHNNNNGEKIGNSPITHKYAAKKYIWQFDKNPYYRSFKSKIGSFGVNVTRQYINSTALNGHPAMRFGITTDYELLSLDDPEVQNYIKYHLDNFKIDWSDATK